MAKRDNRRKRRVNNSESGEPNVNNTTNPPRRENKLRFDFSFEGLYYSVRLSGGKFNNYLSGGSEFIDKFRQIREINAKLKDKKFNEMRGNSRIHFHEIVGKERNIVVNCVGLALSHFYNSDCVSKSIAQLIGNETIYQIGINKGVRLIGTYNNDTGAFRIYLIDYHHRLYHDERRNTHGEKELKFCPMKSR